VVSTSDGLIGLVLENSNINHNIEAVLVTNIAISQQPDNAIKSMQKTAHYQQHLVTA